MIFFKENYKKTIPPFRHGELNAEIYQICLLYIKFIFSYRYDIANQKNIPVNVNISLTLKDVIKIEEINHAFTLKV